MKVYIKRRKGTVDAVAEYNPETKECKVLAGSIVSEKIASSDKFRGGISIKKAREGKIKDNKVIADILFKSASTASNFVTGSSTNGLITWKTENGKSIKDVLEAEKNE